MSGEFTTEYSPETVASACTAIERAIENSGSLKQYLLELQVTTAQTVNGRAELIRLQRVGTFMTDPLEEAATARSDAFYNGALLASAILAEVSADKEFLGGSYAHNHMWDYVDEQRLVLDLELHGTHGRQNLEKLSTDLRDITFNWPHVDDAVIERLYDMAEQYLYTLYPDDEDLYCDSLIGFFTPVIYAYDEYAMDPLEKSILDLDQELETAAVDYWAHINSSFVPTPEELDAAVGDMEASGERKDLLEHEREKIMHTFNQLRYGAGSIAMNPPDDIAALALQRYAEVSLNTLNRNNELIIPGEPLEVRGSFLYQVQRGGEDTAEFDRMTPHARIIGQFDSLVIIDVPVASSFGQLLGGMNANNSDLIATKTVPTPALLMRNLTRINTKAAQGGMKHDHFTSLGKDTVIAVPLCYRGVRVARLQEE